MDAIEKSSVMDAGGIVIRERIIRFPDLLRLVFLELQQNRSRPVTGRQKNEVVDNNRRGRGNRIAHRWTKWKIKEHLPVDWISAHKARPRQKQNITPASDCRRARRRVTRFVIRGSPKDFPIALIERDDAGLFSPTHDQHDRVALDQRRAGDAEKSLRRLKFLPGV